MKSVDLLHKFVQIVPEFEKHWEAERKYNCEPEGHFTLHALCSELSQCFREHYRVLTEVQLAELFEFIELNLVEPGAEETKLDNALCTCFLENICAINFLDIFFKVCKWNIKTKTIKRFLSHFAQLIRVSCYRPY